MSRMTLLYQTTKRPTGSMIAEDGIGTGGGATMLYVESLEMRLVLTAASPRIDANLDASWKFHKGDASGAQAAAVNESLWSITTLPHTWNATDGADGGNNYYRGIGWYRRHCRIPSSSAGRQFVLKFDGASMQANVWVNGKLTGQHAGAYSAFAL